MKSTESIKLAYIVSKYKIQCLVKFIDDNISCYFDNIYIYI